MEEDGVASSACRESQLASNLRRAGAESSQCIATGLHHGRGNTIPGCRWFVAASAYVTAEDRCFVVPSGVCMLESPICISREVCSRSNGFFKLTAEMEVLVRTSPAVGGHSLNSQFSFLAGASWRCWLLKACDINSLSRGGAASCLRVEHNDLRAMGVDPILTGSLEEVLPSLHCGEPPTGTCSELPPLMQFVPRRVPMRLELWPDWSSRRRQGLAG